MEIVVNILNNFINVLSMFVSSPNKLELFCGISAIIVAYIIFIAELVSSKDSSKIYKRIIIKKSGIIIQLIILRKFKIIKSVLFIQRVEKSLILKILLLD